MIRNQKLEQSSDEKFIKEEVRILTRVLEETTEHIAGKDAFDKIKELCRLSADKKYEELEEQIAGLSIEEMSIAARYFSILPLLINITEDVDLAYEVNYQNNAGGEYLGKLSGAMDMTVKKEDAAYLRLTARTPSFSFLRIQPVSTLPTASCVLRADRWNSVSRSICSAEFLTVSADLLTAVPKSSPKREWM